jgi:hypothetical protein
MEIPLCHMISMQIARPTLTNDILKLQRDFYFGYHPQAKAFCISLREEK